jgi:hypothetical protein
MKELLFYALEKVENQKGRNFECKSPPERRASSYPVSEAGATMAHGGW